MSCLPLRLRPEASLPQSLSVLHDELLRSLRKVLNHIFRALSLLLKDFSYIKCFFLGIIAVVAVVVVIVINFVIIVYVAIVLIGIILTSSRFTCNLFFDHSMFRLPHPACCTQVLLENEKPIGLEAVDYLGYTSPKSNTITLCSTVYTRPKSILDRLSRVSPFCRGRILIPDKGGPSCVPGDSLSSNVARCS